MEYRNMDESSLPLISVIIPVFNGEAYLRRCFDSIDSQNYKHYEAIVIDDGSTDNSAQIAAQWAEANDKVKYIKQSNCGPGIARNTGLEAATGQYLLFLDPDDHYSPELLSRLAEAAVELDADVVICSSDSVDSVTGTHRDEPWHLKLNQIPSAPVFSGKSISDKVFQFAIGWPWDKLFKRSFVESSQIVYPDLRNSEDGVFVFPLLCLANRICVIPDVLISHEVNRADSVSFKRASGPTCFAEAIELINITLQRFNILEAFQSSFVTWALDFSLWNLDSAPQNDQDEILQAIRGKVIPVIKFYDLPKTCFQDPCQHHRIELLAKHDNAAVNMILELEAQNEHLQDRIRSIEQSRSYNLAKRISRIGRILNINGN